MFDPRERDRRSQERVPGYCRLLHRNPYAWTETVPQCCDGRGYLYVPVFTLINLQETNLYVIFKTYSTLSFLWKILYNHHPLK